MEGAEEEERKKKKKKKKKGEARRDECVLRVSGRLHGHRMVVVAMYFGLSLIAMALLMSLVLRFRE